MGRLVYKIFPPCVPRFSLHPTPTSMLSSQKGGGSYDSLHQTVPTLRPILSTLASHVRKYATGGIFIIQAKQVLSFFSSFFPFLSSLSSSHFSFLKPRYSASLNKCNQIVRSSSQYRSNIFQEHAVTSLP